MGKGKGKGKREEWQREWMGSGMGEERERGEESERGGELAGWGCERGSEEEQKWAAGAMSAENRSSDGASGSGVESTNRISGQDCSS